MTGILPQTQKDFIKSEIAKDVNGTDELRWCLNNARHNWDYWGFQNERQCELANLKYKKSLARFGATAECTSSQRAREVIIRLIVATSIGHCGIW